MVQAVSIDLRRRLARAIAQGKSRRAAAAQFEVAPSTAVRLQQRLDRTGSLEPERCGRPAGSGKLAPYRDRIIGKVKEQPDITMPDLAGWLLDREGISVAVDPSNLSKLPCKAGFTYKKSPDGDRAKARRRPARAR